MAGSAGDVGVTVGGGAEGKVVGSGIGSSQDTDTSMTPTPLVPQALGRMNSLEPDGETKSLKPIDMNVGVRRFRRCKNSNWHPTLKSLISRKITFTAKKMQSSQSMYSLILNVPFVRDFTRHQSSLSMKCQTRST
jgi:hypothetical protein